MEEKRKAESGWLPRGEPMHLEKDPVPMGMAQIYRPLKISYKRYACIIISISYVLHMLRTKRSWHLLQVR